MSERLLCASMMCANYENLSREVRELDEAGIDVFHCDIMDGSFVPNLAMGITDVREIRKHTDRMLDCHLMIERPADKVDWFIDAGADLVYIHPESERYVVRTLAHIRERGVKTGIALNPDTSFETAREMLWMADFVMAMTVSPGFSGQKFIDFTLEKISKLVEMKPVYGYKVVVDGACSPEVVGELSRLGCDGFILGTSALFGKNGAYSDLLRDLRN